MHRRVSIPEDKSRLTRSTIYTYDIESLPVPPKITSDLSIRDMTVIAGEPFTITVPYTANPKPRPSWSINGEEVLTGDRIKFDTTDVASQFINKKAKRSDTGNYTIYLTNTVGTDSASCKVLVVGESIRS